MSRPQYDRADAKALLDDRGYSGTLVRGQNPALLFEKGVRERITDSFYWKEQCFGLSAATLCDRAAELDFIGGTTGIMGRPTPFLCLAFKLLQLVPEKDIILEYLNFRDDYEEEKNEDGEREQNGEREDGEEKDEETARRKIQELNAAGKLGEYKYLRCLAAFYVRLAWEPVEIYNTLEPLLTDFRKIRRRTKDGFTLTYVDQFIDDLLTKDRICATSLWKMPPRTHLEDLDMLEPRESPLDDEVDELDEDMEQDRRSLSSERSYRSRDMDSRSSRSRSSNRSRGSGYRYSRSRSRSPSRSRSYRDSRSSSRSNRRDRSVDRKSTSYDSKDER